MRLGIRQATPWYGQRDRTFVVRPTRHGSGVKPIKDVFVACLRDRAARASSETLPASLTRRWRSCPDPHLSTKRARVAGPCKARWEV